MTPVDQLLEKIATMKIPDLLQFGTPRLVMLTGAASMLLSQFDEEDQGVALGIMYGVLCADLEHKMCQIDDHMISFGDRLAIFRAIATSAYIDYLKQQAEHTPAEKRN